MSFKAFTNFPTFNLQSPSNPNAKRSKEECFCALTIAQDSVQVEELPKALHFPPSIPPTFQFNKTMSFTNLMKFRPGHKIWPRPCDVHKSAVLVQRGISPRLQNLA